MRMTKGFLAVAVMTWMLGAGLASAQMDDQPQPDPSEQQQMANKKDAKKDGKQEASCPTDKDRPSKAAQDADDAPQNHVEYGGGA